MVGFHGSDGRIRPVGAQPAGTSALLACLDLVSTRLRPLSASSSEGRSWRSAMGEGCSVSCPRCSAWLPLILATALPGRAQSHAPKTLRILGVVTVVAGIITPLVGVDRAHAIGGWWADRGQRSCARGPGLRWSSEWSSSLTRFRERRTYGKPRATLMLDALRATFSNDRDSC